MIAIPTGDAIMLVFYHSPEAPVKCVLEISRALKKHPCEWVYTVDRSVGLSMPQEKGTWLVPKLISHSDGLIAATESVSL